MKTKTMVSVIVVGVIALLNTVSLAVDIPVELKKPNYRTTPAVGLGYDAKFGRQDPSNVIKVGDTFYVYYSKFSGGNVYAGGIAYATSPDGVHWKEQGQALERGKGDAWDNFGVLTPYAMNYGGKYYLYYTASKKVPDQSWKIRGENNKRHVGLAISDSPDGPWKKLPKPVLSPGKEGEWDSYLVDDTHIIVRDGKFWFYYKGGDPKVTADTTRWGLAIGDSPEGPFVKEKNNPVTDSGHTVCLWPYGEGVAALVDRAGPQRCTMQYSPDGKTFYQTAKLRDVHVGCGPYDPDAFTNAKFGRGVTWGITCSLGSQPPHLIRFEVDGEAKK